MCFRSGVHGNHKRRSDSKRRAVASRDLQPCSDMGDVSACSSSGCDLARRFGSRRIYSYGTVLILKKKVIQNSLILLAASHCLFLCSGRSNVDVIFQQHFSVLSSLVSACMLQVDYTRMGFEGMWPSLLSMARYGTNTQVRLRRNYCRRDVNTQVRLRRIYCRHDVNTQVRLQRIYGLCNNVLSMRRVYCRHYISTNT